MTDREKYPKASLNVPEAIAKRWIWVFSGIVFLAVVVLDRVQVPTTGSWDVHVFAKVNALLNSLVSVLLLAGLALVGKGNYAAHKKVMFAALVLSVLFLISYISHHLFAGETKFGGTGAIKVFYYVVLITHIVLAATSLPFILLTAYKAMVAQFGDHRKLARKVWPVWFYVSVSGVLVYFLISPYY